MRVHLFRGPTITQDQASAILPVTCHPPASQGDIYRVARQRPHVIALVDGVFGSVPTVWHHEILWAMTQGIHVFGAASMGALRAAELAHFGMHGVGKVFEAFLSGALEDDDEVAVLHLPQQGGFARVTEAMVDIRRTLDDAVRAEAVSPAAARCCAEVAKALHFSVRTYPDILEALRPRLTPPEIDALAIAFDSHRRSQKLEDATEMLLTIRASADALLQRNRARYNLETTVYADWALSSAGPVSPSAAGGVATRAILAELRLQGRPYFDTLREAKLRTFALARARSLGLDNDAAFADGISQRFRRARGIDADERFQRWLAGNDLSHQEFDALMREEAAIVAAEALTQGGLESALLDSLRLRDDYTALRGRALDKRLKLQTSSRAGSGALSETQLLTWYFTHARLPAPRSMSRFAAALGFRHLDELLAALREEYDYVALVGAPPAADPRGPADQPPAAEGEIS